MILRKNSLKYKILETLAFLGDAGLELLMNEVLVSGKTRFAGRKKYSSRHFEKIFKELTTVGYIKRVRNKKGIEYLKLSTNGESRIFNLVPLPNLQKRKWDGYFRAIPYDFPEKIRWKRAALREKVKEWGMGRYQLSLWITPHPLEDVIEDFLQSKKLDKYASLFMSRKLSIDKGKRIARKVWDIESLENKYLDFIDKWEKKIVEESFNESDLEKVRFEYFSILEVDPHLPYDLLAEEWPAKNAKGTFLEIERRIRKMKK
jgi:DNA-binding transcriptional regulator PaaX